MHGLDKRSGGDVRISTRQIWTEEKRFTAYSISYKKLTERSRQMV